MARKRLYKDLYLYMNGVYIGTLAREAGGNLIFTYDANWLKHENSRPISLSLPLTEVPYKGLVVENYFDNLLPDSALIRKRIQTRFGAPSNNCFDLLSYIGNDCIGAIQLTTAQIEKTNVKKILAKPISNSTIAKILKNYQSAPLGMDQELDFRISIAGAQEKTALLWHEDKWFLPQGPTPTSHIIKLPIGLIKHAGIDLSESVENEWLCLKILSAYNLPVNNAQIKFFDDVKTLVLERFDRRWANSKWLLRLPQEDFCQALGKSSALKYESDGGPGILDIMKLLLGSKEAVSDREKFMKAVFLFWVMGAIDGHAKNFSISIEAQGRYQLTPFYDVISVYPIAAKHQLEWRKIKMAMSLKSKDRHYLWNTIQLRHWLTMANLCQFPAETMRIIFDEIFDNMENIIKEVSTSLPKNFPKHISEPIFQGMRQIKNRSLILRSFK